MAVTRNSDYLIAAINLKKNRLDSRYYKNLMRPDLDLDIGLSFKGRDSRLSVHSPMRENRMITPSASGLNSLCRGTAMPGTIIKTPSWTEGYSP